MDRIRSLAGLNSVLFVAVTVAVIACGGGSSGGANSGDEESNQAPTANAGADQTRLAATEVILDASASEDSDGTIQVYEWVQTGGDSVALAGSDSTTARFTAPDVSAVVEFEFQLTVTDDAGASGTDTVVVTITPSDIDPEIALQQVFTSLSFTRPVALLQAPGDNTRWFVVEQAGRVMVFDNSGDVATASEFVDLRDRVDTSSNAGESGLLTMSFHPMFDSNGYVYLYYQVSEDTTPPIEDDCCVSRLARYSTNEGGETLNPDSETVLLSFTAPYESKNHFGGQLGFDDEGYLYLSIGDGGSGGDPDNRAQNTGNLWGSMIRIDVDAGPPYGIPPDNPYAAEANFLCHSDANMEDKEAAGDNCPELFAWGLRNPWRWSFDRTTTDLWLADVGQGAWEEVNLIEKGGNYGWRIREGAHCYNPPDNCQTTGLIDPVAEIPQPEFQSITGGYVYRGSDFPSLVGRYLFGDYVTGRVYSLVEDASGGREIEPLISDSGLNIAAFAEDQNGEIYLVDYGGGIYRLVEESVAGAADY